MVSLARLASEIGQDVALALRQLRKAPAFAAISVTTLALGIGADTAIYSAVYHTLIAPLPYADGDRLVEVDQVLGHGRAYTPPSLEQLDAWRARSRTVGDITGWLGAERTMTGAGDPVVLRGVQMLHDVPRTLGLGPEAGRPFGPEDELPGAAPVMLIGHQVWKRVFGGRADAIGRAVRLDGVPFTIIGVMPEQFGASLGRLDGARDLFIPLTRDATPKLVDVVGKLAPGATIESASHELAAIAASVPSRFGAGTAGARAFLIRAGMAERYRSQLLLLFGAVGLVLLIACANVANLALVRALARQREFAVRTALGASRGRLFRQLLTESIALGLVGGALGALLAWRGLGVLMTIRPPWMRELDNVHVQPQVLVWSLVLALLTGVAFGVAPAFLSTRRGIEETLKGSARSTTGHAGVSRLRSVLMVGELGLAVVLLVSAGLLVRSLVALERRDLSMDPRGLVTADLRLAEPQLPTPAARAAVLLQTMDAIRSLPGVSGASVASVPPPQTAVKIGDLQIASREAADLSRGFAPYDYVDPSFFAVVGIPVLAGRIFSTDTAEHVAVVSEAFARHFFVGADAVGQRIRVGDTSPWLTIVGVVGNVGERLDGDDRRFCIYEAARAGRASATVVMRASDDRVVTLPLLTRAVAAVSPAAHVRSVTTTRALLAESNAQTTFLLKLLGSFAVVALGLAGLGLYGVVSYTVGQRRREFGVRIALGARTPDVMRLVMGQGMRLVLIGLGAGLAGGLAAAKILRASLYGVRPGDAATYVSVSVLLGGIALVACLVPALRAIRVNPVETLRSEG